MKKPTIIIADDHPILLKGLESFLKEKEYDIIGTATNGNLAYDLIVKSQPEIAILDIKMPKISGIEVARKCQQHATNTKIILITLYKDEALYYEAKDLGVYGYLLKEFALEEIEACLSAVNINQQYFSKDILSYLNISKTSNDILEKLTLTEQKVLALIAQNKTSKEIADILFVTIKTIEKHRTNIRVKLNLAPKTHSLLIWVKENSHLFV